MSTRPPGDPDSALLWEANQDVPQRPSNIPPDQWARILEQARALRDDPTYSVEQVLIERMVLEAEVEGLRAFVKAFDVHQLDCCNIHWRAVLKAREAIK